MSFSDPYLDESSGVLRNLAGIADLEELTQFEAHAVAVRSKQIRVGRSGLNSTWDVAHWKAIHRHLFQDVYEWAGEFRTVEITKGARTFFPSDRLDTATEYVAEQLRAVVSLDSPPVEQLAERLAVVLGDMNEVHPFREGNGRTQREMIGLLASSHGRRIVWEHISADDNIEASIASSTDPGSFFELLLEAMQTER